jgi:cytochrome bd-type quinol oxidase subunit 2
MIIIVLFVLFVLLLELIMSIDIENHKFGLYYPIIYSVTQVIHICPFSKIFPHVLVSRRKCTVTLTVKNAAGSDTAEKISNITVK